MPVFMGLINLFSLSISYSESDDDDMNVSFDDRRSPICAMVIPSGNVTETNVCAGGVDNALMMLPALSPGFKA